MTAPVRIEAEAWTDLRFATLARLLRLAEPVDALIRTARLWGWQTEHYKPEAPTYVVDLDTIESAIGPGAADALVRAKLAEEEPEGYRIRGSRGRIEWLWKTRQAGKAGGEATKRKYGDKTWPLGQASGPPALGAPPSPLIPVLIPTPEDQSSLPARAIPPSPEPAVPPPAPTSTGDVALRRRQQIRSAIWAELGAARAEVAAELGLGPAAAALLAQDPGEQALAMKLLGARSDAELEQIAAQARHAIAISAAEAREAREVEWLTGVMFDSDRVWRRLLGKQPEDVGRRARAGPRSSAERAPSEPVRKIKTLT